MSAHPNRPNVFRSEIVLWFGIVVPAVLGISLVTSKVIELGLKPADICVLLIALLVAVVNFTSDRN